MAWAQQGNLRGPQGPEGPQGPQGPKGEDGAGIEIAGSVSTYAELPTWLGPEHSGDGYIVLADGKLYIWDGSAFPPDGSGVAFRGPEGPQGPQGEQGPQGPQGEQGPIGPTGNTGYSATVAVGSVYTMPAGAPAEVFNDGTPYDAVLRFHIPQGPQGEPGADGANGTNGAKWHFGYGAPGDVPGAVVGDAYLDMADGTVYQLS